LRVVILDNLRSAWNVGSVFRTSAALKYDHIALCGVTITPPSKKLKDTSRGMEDVVPWSSYLTTSEAVEYYKSRDYKVIALESNSNAKSIQDWVVDEKVAWVLGNEANGVAPSILSLCDDALELPMLSEQTGINVSCAFAAAAYQDFFMSKAND